MKNIKKYDETHYKEITPEETLNKLYGKLNSMGLETEQRDYLESDIGTTSLRVVFKGTDIGTNGKGMSPILARASAYGELFERYQNNLLTAFHDLREKSKFNFKLASDEKYLSVAELIAQDDDFIRLYYTIRNMENASAEEKVKTFEKIHATDNVGADGTKRYTCLPFYSVRSNKIVYLPYCAYPYFYGSNGMAAGNTREEALVQALSEIMERVSQTKILKEGPYLPDVPESFIKLYPNIYKMYNKAKESGEFNIIMKDCSFGGKYPVVGLLTIKKNTEHYGFKLGCHPDLGIAMERTFTEATQGGQLGDYIKRSTIDFQNRGKKHRYNLTNSYTMGLAQYPYQILSSAKNAKFVPYKTSEDKTNTGLLHHMVKDIIADGYDILIRDVSYLDFPSFDVIIPRFSETSYVTDDIFRASNTRRFAVSSFMTPENITEEDAKYIIAALGYYKGNVKLDNSEAFFDFCNISVPYGKGAMSTRYMGAMCEVFRGNYNAAYQKLSPMLPHIDTLALEPEEVSRLRAEIMYLSAYTQLQNHDEVMEYMKQILSDDLYAKIDWIYEDRTKVLTKQYPSLNSLPPEALTGPQYIMYEVIDKLKYEMVNNQIDQATLATAF